MQPRDIVKGLFFSIFAIICFAQCYAIIESYLQYPIVRDLYDISPSLVTILPGITICNNNRLSLKKLVKRNRDVGRAMEMRNPDFIQNKRFQLSNKEFNNFRDEVAKILQQLNYNLQDEINNSTLNDLFALRPDTESFIKWLGCARTWKDSIECGMLSQIDSIQDRKCTTILHKGAMLYDIVNRPHLFNSTRTSAGNYSHLFDSKEVVKLVVDFEPEDYADLKRQIGSRVIFHMNNYVSSSSDPDFFITRGYKYEFNIDREDVLLLDKPYGRCWNYEENNLDNYKTKIDPRIPLYVDTCYQNCVIKNIIHRSNCWPPTMPYFRNDSFDPELKLKSCAWSMEPQYISIYKEMLRLEKLKNKSSNLTQKIVPKDIKAEENFKKETKAYTKIRRFCWSQCLLGCKMTQYSVTVTRSAWPTDVRILFDKSGKDRVLRHCCALVTVKYSQFQHNVQEFVPKYNLVDVIGNLGGLLAVWLGLSMVSVYYTIQKLVEICSERSLSKIHIQKLNYKFKSPTITSIEHYKQASRPKLQPKKLLF